VNPGATVQAGIDTASNGEFVPALDGACSSVGNRRIDTKGQQISIESQKQPGVYDNSGLSDQTLPARILTLTPGPLFDYSWYNQEA